MKCTVSNKPGYSMKHHGNGPARPPANGTNHGKVSGAIGVPAVPPGGDIGKYVGFRGSPKGYSAGSMPRPRSSMPKPV